MSTLKIDESWDLSRDEFADAIAKGLGRAFLYVQNHGLDRVKDLVLNACLHHIGYDPQCEGSRAKWLFSMFADSLYYTEVKDAILAALAIETEPWDLLQLCQLAKEMAVKGDIIAADRLADRVYQHAAQPSSNDWVGADELIEVWGIDAAIELSRIYGRRLLANPDDWVPDTLEIFKNMSKETRYILDRYASTEESIATYYRYLVDLKSRNGLCTQQSTQPNKISVERIIELARNKQHNFPSIYMRFGLQATTEELAIIFNLLIHEPDEDICLRLLWVFWRKPLPILFDRLFDWTDSSHDLLKTSTIETLARVSDDRVYYLGRSKLSRRHITGGDASAIDLFINNYHSGDTDLILAGLNDVETDKDDLHTIGCSAIEIGKKQSNPELVNLLKWIYDRTPCSYCRESIVDLLEKYQQQIGHLLVEYQFDATQFKKSQSK